MEHGDKHMWLIIALLLIVGIGAGYWFGGLQSAANYQKGYNKAVADIEEQQKAIAQKAGEDAAKAANPFKVENPLEGVQVNPFEKAQKSLNPFSGK